MTAYLLAGAMWLGLALLVIASAIGVLELVFRGIRFISDQILSQPVTRKDFLAPGYQNYIGWVEDWNRPMFRYLPIGFRHFNNDNPIPGHVRNNSLGFRCDELDAPNPEEFRVVILGGSAAWGSGATSNQTTIAGHLEALLNAGTLPPQFRRARCYNLAQVNGYQTQDILTAVFFASRIGPNATISFTGWNELMANDTMRRDVLERYGTFYINEMEGWEPPFVKGYWGKALGRAWAGWVMERSELARRLGRIAKGPGRAPAAGSLQDHIALGTRLFIWHLETLQALSRGFGFAHLQFLQPYVYRKLHLTEQEARIVELYDHVRPVHGGLATGNYLRENNIYESLLEETRRRNGSTGPVHDLCDIFRDERESRFYTLVHMNDEGYLAVARRMHEGLIEAGVIPGSGGRRWPAGYANTRSLG